MIDDIMFYYEKKGGLILFPYVIWPPEVQFIQPRQKHALNSKQWTPKHHQLSIFIEKTHSGAFFCRVKDCYSGCNIEAQV